MIYTSSHSYCDTNKYNTYAISGNRGKDANYEGKYYSKLAPKLVFWKVWHNNIGKVSKVDNNKYYINEYYNQVLKNLDVEEVYKELNNSILLCYENNKDFCHRHIVAAWFEIMLGIKVDEVKIENNQIKIIDKPQYIKEYLYQTIELNKEEKNKVLSKKRDEVT